MDTFSKEILAKMNELSIDPELTLQRMKALNAGHYDDVKPLEAKEIPEVDGERIIRFNDKVNYFDYKLAQDKIKELGLDIDLLNYGTLRGSMIGFTHDELKELGIALAPTVAYGVLNGGSASSYVDRTKNQKTYSDLYDIYERYFEDMSKVAKGRAKGITPAYINEDSSHGEPFMLLKLRALLIKALKYQIKHNKKPKDLYKVFQMDSVLNSDMIQEALTKYKESELLKELIEETGHDITDVYTASQPLLAALTHEGKPYSVFDKAHGEENNLIPMPGGHGHNFYVLKEIYKKLLSEGKRYAYLTNIDNVANIADDASVAYLALSGKPAGFEFVIKTPVDKKGGIAVIDQYGRLNCGDIGSAIHPDEVKKAEDAGKTILFNCAIGLFDLKHLVENIDNIIEKLPMRHSVQNKDAGKYSQLEQVTWEVIGMLENPVIFAMDKYERFIAAKTLIEGLMASGLELEHEKYPEHYKEIAEKLHTGMKRKLIDEYGMKHVDKKWVPKSLEELKKEIV